MGAADQIIGLGNIVGSGQAGPGDHVLLVGIGAGFSWTAAVIEFAANARPGGPEHEEEV